MSSKDLTVDILFVFYSKLWRYWSVLITKTSSAIGGAKSNAYEECGKLPFWYFWASVGFIRSLNQNFTCMPFSESGFDEPHNLRSLVIPRWGAFVPLYLCIFLLISGVWRYHWILLGFRCLSSNLGYFFFSDIDADNLTLTMWTSRSILALLLPSWNNIYFVYCAAALILILMLL